MCIMAPALDDIFKVPEDVLSDLMGSVRLRHTGQGMKQQALNHLHVRMRHHLNCF